MAQAGLCRRPSHHGMTTPNRGEGRQQVHNSAVRTRLCGSATSALLPPHLMASVAFCLASACWKYCPWATLRASSPSYAGMPCLSQRGHARIANSFIIPVIDCCVLISIPCSATTAAKRSQRCRTRRSPKATLRAKRNLDLKQLSGNIRRRDRRSGMPCFANKPVSVSTCLQ